MKRLLLSLAFVGIFASSGNPLMAMKKIKKEINENFFSFEKDDNLNEDDKKNITLNLDDNKEKKNITNSEALRQLLFTAPKNGLTSLFGAITGMPSATKGFYKKYVHNLGCGDDNNEPSSKPWYAQINKLTSPLWGLHLSDGAALLVVAGLGYLTLVKHRATSKKVSLSTLNFLGRSTSKGLNLTKYGINRTSNAIANYTK